MAQIASTSGKGISVTGRRSALVIGCGYLGEALARRLLERGWEVTATARRPERIRELQALGPPERFRVVPLELEHLEEATWLRSERFRVAVYAVAPRTSASDRLVFGEAPARLQALLSQCGTKFIFVSSTGVYGEAAGAELDESSPPRPDTPRHRLLVETETTLLREPAQPAAVVRLGGLYGPGRSPLDWIRDPGFRSRLRGGDAFMNWIRVEDAAGALALAAERARPGEIYHAVDGHPVRRREFYALAAELAGVPPPEISDDGRRGKRLGNRKIREELGLPLRYPDYRSGLTSLRTP